MNLEILLPSVSVVVPSYNQAQFLEETLCSILDQNYPALELIVIDGGSTDGSLEIIKKYSSQITYWVSEPDRGQSHAINKGFEKATGEWVAWMNSDDCYLPGALKYIFSELPHHQYDFIFGTCTTGTELSNREHRDFRRNYKQNLFQLLLFFHSTEHMIPSQSVFVRRTLLGQTGMIDETLHLVMDLEWFARIFRATKRRLYYRYPACFYRKHPLAKTSNYHEAMQAEAMEVARKYQQYLNSWQQFKLGVILNQSVYRKCFSTARGFWQIIFLGLRFPLHCMHTRHYFPMLYRSLFPRSA